MEPVHPARQGRDRRAVPRIRLRALPRPPPVHQGQAAAAHPAAPRPRRSPGSRPRRAENDQLPGRLRPPRRRRGNHAPGHRTRSPAGTLPRAAENPPRPRVHGLRPQPAATRSVLERHPPRPATNQPPRTPRTQPSPHDPGINQQDPASLQRLTCPRQRPCGHEHQARYPASYTGTFREETRPCGTRFPAAFQPPAFASWAPCPARDFRPSYDRPTAPPAHTRACTADPDEVYTFRTRETRTGPGALCTPGTTVSAGHRGVRGRRLPPLNGRSLAPRHNYPARDV